jgi:hypothetical protein
MRARVYLILAAGLGLFVFAPAVAQTPDIRRSESHNYKIERNGKGFRATARVRVDQTYLAERSLGNDLHFISEYAECKVSKVSAWARGVKLDNDYTVRFQPVRDDVFFNESGTWLINFSESLKPGEAIAYEYRLECADINMLPAVRLPNVDLMDKFLLQFEHPAGVRIDFDFFFPHGPVDYRIDRSIEQTTILTFTSIPGAKKLPYFEYNDERVGILIRFYDKDRLVNPVTVEGLGDWYRTLLAGVSTEFPAVDSSFLDSLAATSVPREKARLIYDYVRLNLRYIMEARRAHAYAPTPPAQVWRDKYGDCKDRAFLVKTLADRAGITVRMVVCPAKPGLGFSGIHSSLTNHVFCALIDGSDTLFFDPTARLNPFGSLPESDIGKRVVVVDSVNARFAEVLPLSSEPAVSIYLDGSADSLSNLRARVVLKDREFTVTLEAMKALTPSAFSRVLDSLVTSRLYKIDLDSLKVTSQTYDSLVLEGTADLSGFVVVSPKRSYLPRVPFTVIDTKVLSRRDDTLALFFEHRDALKIQMDLTSTGAVLTPDSVSLGSPESAFFSASAAADVDGHLHLTYEFNRQAKILSGNAKTEFLRFCDDFLNAKKNMFVMEVAR